MPAPTITQKDIAEFRDNGFVIKRGFYSVTEIELVAKVCRAEMSALMSTRALPTAPEIWDSIPHEQHDLGNKTLFNALCYAQRMVSAFDVLLTESCPSDMRWGRTRPDTLPGGVSLHHRKLIVKDKHNHRNEEPQENDYLGTEKPIGGGYRGGNRFLWHQDFWYWGNEDGQDAYGRAGRPFPDLATCFIAIDPATRENGCLELLRGSHKLGAVDFEIKPWGQRCPTPKGIDAALAAGCKPVFVELDPGDVCFFHCEMLHQSAPNNTDVPRWAFLVCFDPMHNAPVGEKDWRKQASAWSDDCVMKFGEEHLNALEAVNQRVAGSRSEG